MSNFGSHLVPWEHHGDSKRPSKGPAREARELLEPVEKTGWKRDDLGDPRGGATLRGVMY